MNVNECITSRRSIRALNNKKVLRSEIEEIIEVSRFAPSVHNAQPGYFIINDEKLENIWNVLEEKTPKGAWKKVINANMLLAVCMSIPFEDQNEKETEFYLESIGAIIQNILLAAHERGLGTCWLGGNTQKNEAHLKKYFNIPVGDRLITLISFGYYDPELIVEKPKKSLKEIIHYNQYKNNEHQ